MEHKFVGPAYTIGIEEELMILDAESLELVNAIEGLLEPAPAGEIKPELMESVLEVSTDPCANTAQAGEQLRALRAQVREAAARKDLTIGSAGTHPFAMWEDQRIVARPRYRDLVSALRFVARQELIFGMHWLAARHGLDGELVDLPHWDRVPARELARRLLDRIRDHCQDLGSLAELEAVEDLLDRGNGAARQVVVYEANHDLREVMGEIVAATAV